MEIFINGKQEEVHSWTISQLIEKRGLEAGSLVIELNREIVKQAEWADIHLQEGDKLELLSFVGGG